MAKIINYNCDICNQPIQTKYRQIKSPSGVFVSAHPSYVKLVFKQMDIDRGYPENEMSLDICEKCEETIKTLIERRRNYGN